ncbi:bifunctional diaminohydroxyphosphoribosylaminopyrimidine deaminase/5-amino-6-(5-phosphoribosylamino)uracil reductase RibD [Aeromicrobium sp. Leaf245]|uniref:bifunctional diaminohydroxyphosphoribosylaminopyrimidine deaminase/5-amino-6-(5-phosphoribosylamino)uracil reductase RibD n=1 Tax=Aeromicrobium sp. Leaf245 TaxID=1736306 RepID=UPI0006F57EB0|nr:bifunctional diaminohydroxyphosphoribosylaminopyrimidine deaminase/5-amino-6-(5-phosphoribosylamino)uracil reductase RibD [Aeromicrobium sp. Leaf245]KQO38209.1 bifunctional diaminohydroxyphosphoribosylaminopyrimidine deaminase/5-amino-6-(5-phosphoribosylamino)uracil reductase [Aeromicrobium sp. Leaf245]
MGTEAGRTGTEQQAMRMAIDAARSVASALPNPRVGCVLLTPAGERLAVGLHRGAGTPHAEVDALQQAGDAARGATAVVTLEPCAHTGRTGPCAEALLEAGVARVVFAQTDPNPEATGGADRLRAAGVEVESGLLADEAAELNVEWTFALTHGRPFVTWKYAATMDGLSAAPDGSSKWITSAEARRDVQLFRAGADAIMAGTGAVLADDPRLTVRDADDLPLPYDRQPLRVVVGETHIPSYYRVFDRVAPTLLVQSREPDEVLAKMVENGVRHVWLEGGPRLAGAFWNAGLVDRVIGYIAPAMLGSGRAALEGEAATLADLRPIDLHDVARIGPDIRIIGTPGRAPREEMP